MYKLVCWKPAIALAVLFILCLGVYWPGLAGGFIFDDFPNLSSLGAFGGVKDFETFKSFVLDGFAGPLGRPISLASFVLDGTNWPTDPYPFKRTNLLIHLFSGFALFCASLNLLKFYGAKSKAAIWVAVLNTAFWLLHPYMVSSTLYVVQRMAQLAALFVFVGLAGYLQGRLQLGHKPLAAYLWMSASVGLGTLLAAFSKENGILLPLFVLVVEFCRPKEAMVDGQMSVHSTKPGWRWCAIFIWLPIAAIFWQLAKEVNFSPNNWPTRPFNQVERLLTEPRIIWEYLYHLYIPRIEGRGLFQDAFTISKDIFSPWTTLPSILGVFGLLVFGFWARNRGLLGAYTALAIFFFFSAHLVESTVVGLELYFEHRNYVAAAFLFLPIAVGIVYITERRSQFIGVSTASFLILMLCGLTWQRSMLWADTEGLQTYWAVASPNSARAQNHLAGQLINQGRGEEAAEFLQKASARLPDSSLLTMQFLITKIQLGTVTDADFSHAFESLPKQQFDAQALVGLRKLVEMLTAQQGEVHHKEQALALLDEMRTLPQYKNISVFQRMEPYLRGLLLLSLGQPVEASAQMRQVMKVYRETDAALSVVADVARAGYYQSALNLLVQAKEVFAQQSDKTLKRSRSVYEQEFVRMEGLLREGAAKEKRVE